MPMDHSKLNNGETKRFECDECQKEFEVTLEPKCAEMKDPPKGYGGVDYCPFCGTSNPNEV